MKIARLATVAGASCSPRPSPPVDRARRPSTSTRGRRPGAPTAGTLIGVTMPTKSSERWIADGDNIKAALEGMGYKVDLQYAENDIPTQVNQIENQITRGAKLLVVASIDGTALTTQLQSAKDNNIPVIAYDRLIRNSPNVDYYATFDNFKVGVEQATSLLVGLGAQERGRRAGHRHRPVQHRAVRRLARRQQRHLLLQRRHVGAQAADRQRHPGGQERPDRLQHRGDPALGPGDGPGAAWRT